VELRDLDIFVAVATELHFTRAAQKLMLSPATVSSTVRDLERELGAELLVRTSRSVRLTPSGEAFLASSREVLEAARRARQAVEPAIVFGAGEVPPWPALTMAVINALDEPWRSCARPVGLPWAQHLQAVLDGQIDVGVAYFMRGQKPPKLLSGVPVGGPGRCGALVPDDHPLAQRGSVHVSELAEFPMGFVAREFNPDFFDAMMTALAADGFTPVLRPQPAGPFSQNVIQSNTIAQRLDGGWSLAADFLTRHPPAGVAGLPLEGLPNVRTQMWAIWRATLGQTVQQHLREVYRKVAPGFDLDRESDPDPHRSGDPQWN
jgi:DNA-binding transcriptional LysR family regulator